MFFISLLDGTALPDVMKLVSRAIDRLNLQGIHQWDQVYPDVQTIGDDIDGCTLRGLFRDDCLVGIITLNEKQDSEYSAIEWSLDDPAPLVIHRLCLDPDVQGQGLSKLLIQYAEDYAQANGYRSIRLDAFSKNPVSLNLYRSLGYAERGLVTFRKGQFHCFEKILQVSGLSDF